MTDYTPPPWATPDHNAPTPVVRRKAVDKQRALKAAIQTLITNFNAPDNSSIWICRHNGAVTVNFAVQGSKNS
jgi:hypothetical protein